MSKEEKAKPCPFCKSTDLAIVCSAVELSVVCSGCMACSPPSFESKEEAIKAWNNRPIEESYQETIGVHVKALMGLRSKVITLFDENEKLRKLNG